jgi:hypothetical protein
VLIVKGMNMIVMNVHTIQTDRKMNQNHLTLVNQQTFTPLAGNQQDRIDLRHGMSGTQIQTRMTFGERDEKEKTISYS